MSPPTQYRLYGRRFLQVKRPNQQYQSTEGDATKENAEKSTTKYTHKYEIVHAKKDTTHITHSKSPSLH